MASAHTTESKDLRRELTEKIVAELEKGSIPWEKPWSGAHGVFSRPYNVTTEKPYQGGNALHLALVASANSWDDPRWCTYNQARDNGWQVRKGEKGTLIEYWKFHDEVTAKGANGKPILGEDGKPKTTLVERERPYVMHFYVFNASQIEGVPSLESKKYEWTPEEKAEDIIKKSGAVIKCDQSNRAFYDPRSDEIHLPQREQFATGEKFYGTALHELGHWTGHESRLNREVGKHHFGTEEYAKEELRAELTSLFLSGETGIPQDIGSHAAYIQSWIKVLKEDKNEIFKAARDAEKALEYVVEISKKPEKEITGGEREKVITGASFVDVVDKTAKIRGDKVLFHMNGEDVSYQEARSAASIADWADVKRKVSRSYSLDKDSGDILCDGGTLCKVSALHEEKKHSEQLEFAPETRKIGVELRKNSSVEMEI